MLLPPDFSFSQHNLQDYVDCPRRFLLKYIQKVAWPAIQSEPVLELERQMELGSRFHRSIQQFYLGFDPATLEAQSGEVELAIWLRNFLAVPKFQEFKNYFPETTLSTTLDGFRIVAKFDLFAVTQEDEFLILDWKTSRRKPKRAILQQRMQTRLYPFVLCSSLDKLIPGDEFEPGQLSMVYWFADFPEEEEVFHYDPGLFEKDRGFLSKIIGQINISLLENFSKTTNEKLCRFCVYRSHCERGVGAGDLDELDEIDAGDDLTGLSFLDAEEIPF